jgi:hypothetical protein
LVQVERYEGAIPPLSVFSPPKLVDARALPAGSTPRAR